MSHLRGMGKDVPVAVNPRGGKQSALPYRFDLMDGPALFALARVLAEGAAKYGDENWRRIETRDHINHALAHLYAHLSGDAQDDHLTHALCRVLFATAVHLADERRRTADD